MPTAKACSICPYDTPNGAPKPVATCRSEASSDCSKSRSAHIGPWKTAGQLEWESMKWVHWYNKDRLHGVIGYQTPNEKEDAFRQQNNELEKAAQVLNKTLSGKPGTIQFLCV